MDANLNEHFSKLRGQEFIDEMRSLAIICQARGQYVTCVTCKNRATYIGMQECGAPGGPVCDDCLQRQAEWVALTRTIAGAQPWCRHCDLDIDPADTSHVYAVSLFDPTEERIVF
jgi:hypothetical protein